MIKLRCSDCNTVVPVEESVGQRCKACHELPFMMLAKCARPFVDASYQKVHKGRGEEWQASFSPDEVLALRDAITYWAPGGKAGRAARHPGRRLVGRAVNCCEHGDHEAPEGKRFCSEACLRCEHESEGENGCDGICLAALQPSTPKEG